MELVERHIITKNNKEWKKIDKLCLFSKALYNRSLYLIKNHYKDTSKFLRYKILDKKIREEENELYTLLPNNSSQQTLILLDRNFKSFFAALRAWKKDKSKFESCPQPPNYKKKDGRNIVIFTNNQAKLKDGFIKFPKRTELKSLKTKVDNLQQVRIVPRSSCYIIEVIYKKEVVDHNLNKDNYLAIDLGINNLATITTNQPGLKPILINGKPLKSINQYYNKKKAQLQSELQKNHNKKWSNKLSRLTLKRGNKIDYYMHHVSKFVVNYCVENDIGNIIIGYNKDWKQDVNMGKKNNQSFVMVPFLKLISQIGYKSELNSIEVIKIEESYTSKCSALDLEEICRHDEYVGKRKSRGLFKWSGGLLNADVNGSLNILRKVAKDDGFVHLFSRGCVDQPVKVNPLQSEQYKFSLKL